jgi:hypothetical protein
MRRWLSIATFSLILLAMPVWAQHRGGGGSGRGGGGHFGGGGGGHFTSHGGSVGHSSVGHFSGSMHSGNFAHGSGFSRGPGVRVRTGDRFHHHRHFFAGSNFYPYYPYASYYPYGYSMYDDPFFYDNNEDQDSYASNRAPSYEAPPPEDSGLRGDVQALSGKIDRLQADVEARNRSKADPGPATALVFRDQHVEEVRNYAIAGGTLWVLNDHQTGKKIPLAQLDLAATAKMNDDRGVDFQVPQPSLSIRIVR